ncbi:unnamed protein product [Heterosigma akashiwo]
MNSFAYFFLLFCILNCYLLADGFLPCRTMPQQSSRPYTHNGRALYMRVQRRGSQGKSSGIGLIEEDERRKQEEPNPNKLYVSNLPFSITQIQLQEFMSQCGEVYAVKLLKNPFTRRNKGDAFVEFTTPIAATNAVMSLNATEYEGRKIYFQPFKPRPTKRQVKRQAKREAKAQAAAAAAEEGNGQTATL